MYAAIAAFKAARLKPANGNCVEFKKGMRSDGSCSPEVAGPAGMETPEKRKFDDQSAAAAAEPDPLGLASSCSQSLGLKGPTLLAATSPASVGAAETLGVAPAAPLWWK
jgi:hypothetical protein